MAIDRKTASVVKQRAESLFTKGRYAEALKAYESIREHAEADPRILLRMGDIARKLDDTPAAVRDYRAAVESFARLGFLIKAIAVCKLIIHIDPSQEEIHARLASLHARAGGPGRPAADERPAAPAQESAAPVTAGPRAGDERPGDSGAAPSEPPPPAREPGVPRTPLFSDFTEQEFLDVVRCVRSRVLGEGEYLFREGDDGDSIFFVSDGAVEVVGRGSEGVEVTLAALGEQSVFGEFGFFANSKRTADVRASSDTRVIELRKRDLERIIETHKRVEQVLFEFYKERVVDRLMALCEVFRPMSRDDRSEILRRVERSAYRAGSHVVREGEAGETMYLVKEGSLDVTTVDRAGESVRVTGLEAGDFFGEVALATSRPRVATVTAMTDVELVVFSRPLIREILERYPAVKDLLCGVIKERVVGVTRVRDHRQAGALV